MILLLVGLGGIYLVYFTDLFRTPQIQISARPRAERSHRWSRKGRSAPILSASFSFDQKLAITELQVVAVADAKTNKYPHALWHLISESNSVPLKGLLYGETPQGMKPKNPKVRAEPLRPQTKYRLLVEAGKRKGQIDFEIPNVSTTR